MDPMERLDPELIGPLQGLLDATGGGINLRDIAATREMLDGMIAAGKAEAPAIPGVSTEDRVVPGLDAGVSVPVRIYRPESNSDTLPALVWMHPGGYVVGNIELDDLMVTQLAADTGCIVISVDYRLAPEHPYPAALDDSFAVMQWVPREAVALGIDPARIAIGGASAGGGLAAACCLRARDENAAQACFQLLVYPAIDDSNIEQVGDGVQENLFWTRENALVGWRAYLSGRQGSNDVPVHAAPARATDLRDLPDAYIGVGSADMFMKENIDYAEGLSAGGAAVQLAVYPGAFHAFDSFAPAARVSQRMIAERNAALRAAVAG